GRRAKNAGYKHFRSDRSPRVLGRTEAPLANGLRDHFGERRRRSQRLHFADTTVGINGQFKQYLSAADGEDRQSRRGTSLQLRRHERLLRRDRDSKTTDRNQQ